MAEWLVARIANQLERDLSHGLARLDIKHFIPRCLTRSGKVVPLFPSYAFVFSPGSWYELTNVRGFMGVVANRRDKAPWRSAQLDRCVEELKRMAGDDGILPVEFKPSRFCPGDLVQVVSGIFCGHSGTVLEEHGDKFYLGVNGMRLLVKEDDLELKSKRKRVRADAYRARRSRQRSVSEVGNAS